MARPPRWADAGAWTSYDGYLAAQANVLEKDAHHPLVLDHTLLTRLVPTRDGSHVLVETQGEIRCRYRVVVEVSLYARIRRAGRRHQREMNMISVLYEVYVRGRPDSTLLRYDDHGREDWHRHIRDDTGTLVREPIMRREIPDIAELLDEIAQIVGG